MPNKRNIYGHWIDPTGKVFEVIPFSGHQEWLQKNCTDLSIVNPQTADNCANMAVYKGWIRTTLPNRKSNEICLDYVAINRRQYNPLLYLLSLYRGRGVNFVVQDKRYSCVQHMEAKRHVRESFKSGRVTQPAS
ncbi:MAG: hypothetical protein ACTSXQ_04855 [Alphaproteobacteria bacterium]